VLRWRVGSGTVQVALREQDSRREIESSGRKPQFREDDPAAALLGAASIRSRIAPGPEAGAPWRRLGDRIDPVVDPEFGES